MDEANLNGSSKGKRGVLTLEGNVTIHEAVELKASLLKYLEEFDNVVLDLDKVTSLDITCIQLICSAHQTSLRCNKLFTLKDKRPEEFTAVVKDAGLLCHRGCFKDSPGNCLWM